MQTCFTGRDGSDSIDGYASDAWRARTLPQYATAARTRRMAPMFCLHAPIVWLAARLDSCGWLETSLEMLLLTHLWCTLKVALEIERTAPDALLSL